ncbi:MotA/TolQ/ExbB proton channel family protein [Synechococcus sp. Nb3U1]|nr:MotA/TolQ/ExbB proton channel family protein [Synechococcus sp. Nb3U1]MCF2971841.1 MotA/TolQ/ExbB proton channel family protein [Synechococcus sp. Nb3U1]
MDTVLQLLIRGWYFSIPLLMFSIFSVACCIERGLFWWKITHRQEAIVRQSLNQYRRNPRAAQYMLEQNADLPIARIFLAGLDLNEASPEDFRLALETALAAEVPLLKRFNTVFDTVITIAPFLGLLGTVTGIIQILSSIQLGDIGGTDTQGVGQGIAEALYSTAFGLIVAIPTLLISNTFRSLYLRQLSKIQEYGGELELLHRQRQELQTQQPSQRPHMKPGPTSSSTIPPYSSLEQSVQEPYANPGREF